MENESQITTFDRNGVKSPRDPGSQEPKNLVERSPFSMTTPAVSLRAGAIWTGEERQPRRVVDYPVKGGEE